MQGDVLLVAALARDDSEDVGRYAVAGDQRLDAYLTYLINASAGRFAHLRG